jgi:alpha-tubulin suppressor-like RCC1 family protein
MGQLGNISFTSTKVPMKITAGARAVMAAGNQSFLLRNNTLFGTGSNGEGELGDGTTLNKSSFVKIIDNVKAISAGHSHTLILREDNSLWATGENVLGQFGDGSYVNKSTPVKVMDNVKAFAAGGFHTIILKMDNTLWISGENSEGQLGDGTFMKRNTFY